MKLCDANFIPRRQVHKLALAAGFAVDQLVQKERQMVQVVRGRIWSSTPWTFLSTCVIDDELRAVAESVMVLSLGSASVNRYASSQIAAGALCVGNLVLGREAWSEAEEDQTWYSEPQLRWRFGVRWRFGGVRWRFAGAPSLRHMFFKLVCTRRIRKKRKEVNR